MKTNDTVTTTERQHDSVQSTARGNALLDALSENDFERIAPQLATVRLERGVNTYTDGKPFDHVDFPAGAVLSLVVHMRDGKTCEVGSVGREGFVEVDAALDSRIARRTSFCEIPGLVVRMPLPAFRTELEKTPAFRTLIRHNVIARMFTSEQFAACNATHVIEQRLARWLLMLRERVGRDEFPLTQEFVAMMLGIRRAGAGDALKALRTGGAIDYTKGTIFILDPERLQQVTCECAEAIRETFRRSLSGEDAFQN